jgi:hypothetical protein
LKVFRIGNNKTAIPITARPLITSREVTNSFESVRVLTKTT